jgi:hypothetical protein
MINFRNRSNPGLFKVCKIAGPGVPEFTMFRFVVRGFGATNAAPPQFATYGVVERVVDVRAGDPATGGNCQFVPGFGSGTGFAQLQTFVNGTPVHVFEQGLAPGQSSAFIPAGGALRVAGIRSTSGFIQPSPFAPSPNPDIQPGTNADPATSFLGRAAVPARAEVVEVEFTNFVFNPAQLKICKIAGQGVAVGTPFTFTVALQSTLGQNGVPLFPTYSQQVTVLAGSEAQGGTCTLIQGDALDGLVGGAFNQGQTYTITETATAGVVVTGITSPSSPTAASCTATGGLVVGNPVTTGRATLCGTAGVVAGVNTVTFTNTGAAFTNLGGLGPTAGTASVSGRVITPQGKGIINVVVTMTDSEGNTRSTVSTTGGYYRFDEVEVGSTYVITVTGKRFTFSQASQVVNVVDDTEEINFISNSVKRFGM